MQIKRIALYINKEFKGFKIYKDDEFIGLDLEGRYIAV